MEMNKINGSPLANPNLVEKFQGSNRSDAKQDPGVSQSGQNDGSQPGLVTDRAEISETGKKLVELRRTVDAGRAAVEALPETRAQRMAEVRARLENGEYDSVEVRTQVAARLENVIKGLDSL